jgi:hypothetical protein
MWFELKTRQFPGAGGKGRKERKKKKKKTVSGRERRESYAKQNTKKYLAIANQNGFQWFVRWILYF